MKQKNLRFESEFRVVLGNRESQATEMFYRLALRKVVPGIVTVAPTSGCMCYQGPVSQP